MLNKLVYKKANKEDLISVAKLFNEQVASLKIYKKLDPQIFKWKMCSQKEFDLNGTILAFNEKELVGFVICTIRRENEGVINNLFVKEEYRNQGIGETLLKEAEFYYKTKNIDDILFYGYLPIGYQWLVPNTRKHYHPCAPGVIVGSDLFDFLLSKNYSVKNYNDAFHLDLKKYTIPTQIEEIIEKNKKDGIDIEFYDKFRHKKLEEFMNYVKPSFKKVIDENLKLDNPKPFLIVSKNNEVKGWVGAIYNEKDGRGHIDGIEIHEDVKGRGLGKALFNVYVNESKKNKAKYMTFYTNRDNIARNIYTSAGFEIVQSFAIMEKKIQLK